MQSRNVGLKNMVYISYLQLSLYNSMMVALATAIIVTIYMIMGMISPLLAQEQNFETYDDPENLFTIQYPSDWEIINETLTGERLGSEYVGYIEFGMRDKVTDQLMYTGINVKVQEEPEQLENLQDLRRNILLHPDPILADAKNPVVEPTTLSGQDAFKVSFHSAPLSLCEGCEDIVPALEGVRVVTFDPQTKYSYTVELSSLPVLFSELVPTFETSLNSFRIT